MDALDCVSFSGCGFLCIYHVGVSAALRLFVPEKVRNEWKLYGSSSGALSAAVLLCEGTDLGVAAKILLDNALQAKNILRSPRKSLNFRQSLRAGIELILPEDAHIRCSGRLHISLTRIRDWKNVVVSQFDTREELIEAILCSCYIFGLFGWVPPKFRGESYEDGAFTGNQPVSDHRTITVNPFDGESDICPSDKDSASLLNITVNGTSLRLTATNIHRSFGILCPPSVIASKKLYTLGFEDTLRFLRTRTSICPSIMHPKLVEFQPAGCDQKKGQSIMKLIRSRKFSKPKTISPVDTSPLYPIEVHIVFDSYTGK